MFSVVPEYGEPPDAQLVTADLRRMLEGRLDVEDRLERRARAARPRGSAAPPPKVTLVDDASSSATVVEVRAHDEPGLLWRIGRALGECGLNVQAARVETLGAEAVDVFYVTARLAYDHTVVVLDRHGDVAVDLGDPDAVRGAAEHVLDRYGRCDVLVHAAAMVAFGPLDEFQLSTWRQVQAVNVESALLLTQAFVPGMRDRGFGRVIFIVSDSYWRPPGAHMLAYVASKGALIGMARTLAVGLGSNGIAVMAVAPGLTRTPATDVVPAEEFADVAAHQPLPRPLTPDDSAAVVAMLAGDDAAALTGQTLTVDGGLVLR